MVNDFYYAIKRKSIINHFIFSTTFYERSINCLFDQVSGYSSKTKTDDSFAKNRRAVSKNNTRDISLVGEISRVFNYSFYFFNRSVRCDAFH